MARQWRPITQPPNRCWHRRQSFLLGPLWLVTSYIPDVEIRRVELPTGLNPRPSNFSDYSDPIPSYLSNLKTGSFIPSLSWAYTAGNQYRLNEVPGSLTLGGYDASRFMPNNLTFPFNQQVCSSWLLPYITPGTTPDIEYTAPL